MPSKSEAKSYWGRAAIVVVTLVAVVLLTLGVSGKLSDGSSASAGSAKPRPSVSPSSAQAAQLLVAGANAQQAKDNDTALADYQAALHLDPTNANAAYDVGELQQVEGNNGAALQAYNQALVSDPKFTSAMFNKAVLLTASQPTVAVALFRQILTIAPRAATTYFDLGLLLIRQGVKVEGETDVAEGVRLSPALAKLVPKGLHLPTITKSGATPKPSAS